MELQIPCSIRAKISTKSILCREAGSDPRDHKAIMPVEGGRNHRGRSMPGPHSSTTQHTTKDQRIRIYGVSIREEQFNDIPKVREHEICISKPGVLVPWLLRRHGREEHGSNQGIYPKSTKN